MIQFIKGNTLMFLLAVRLESTIVHLLGEGESSSFSGAALSVLASASSPVGSVPIPSPRHKGELRKRHSLATGCADRPLISDFLHVQMLPLSLTQKEQRLYLTSICLLLAVILRLCKTRSVECSFLHKGSGSAGDTLTALFLLSVFLFSPR